MVRGNLRTEFLTQGGVYMEQADRGRGSGVYSYNVSKTLG